MSEITPPDTPIPASDASEPVAFKKHCKNIIYRSIQIGLSKEDFRRRMAVMGGGKLLMKKEISEPIYATTYPVAMGIFLAARDRNLHS